jgi:hypothetical protein
MQLHSFSPDVICLQELWQIHDTNSLSLNQYKPIVYKTRSNNVQGGGVGFYFHNNVRFNVLEELSVFIDRIIETLFAEVWISPHKKINVGTIYRPSVNHPTLSSSEQFAQFFDIFSNIMCNFANLNTPVYLFGDLNLDVLRYNITRQVTEYIDLLFSYGFLQIIMKPTRCTPTSASLIDHCITNSNPESLNCKILTSRISDHFPILCSIIDCKKACLVNFLLKNDFLMMRTFKILLCQSMPLIGTF